MTTRRHSQLIVLVAALVVLAGALWTARRWRRQLDSGRAQMLSRLLATSHTPRMIESPGVEAWQMTLFEQAGRELPDDERELYERLRPPSSGLSLPPEAASVAERLHAPSPTTPPAEAIEVVAVPEPEADGAGGAGSLREVVQLEYDGATLVLTRRKSLFRAEATLGPDLRAAIAHLLTIADAWSREPPASADGSALPQNQLLRSRPRLTRLYALLEDGSYLAIAFPEAGPSELDPARQRDALERETHQARRRPRAPSLVSNSVFNLFDFGEPLEEQAHYTGLYADVAGLGFVTTVAVPTVYRDDGLKIVLAADLSVDVAHEPLVAAADPALELVVSEPLREVDTPLWQPWTTLVAALPPDAPEALRREAQLQALHETREEIWVRQRPLVHYRDDDGVLFAQQIERRRWLVGWLAEEDEPLPWVPMLVVPGLLFGLLLWGERRHGRRVDERDAARAQIEQRQAILDELGLPLVVVDPNDDTIVGGNAAAMDQLRLSPGQNFHEQVVAAEPRSQAHYHEHQIVAGGRRRAYGVYLQSSDDQRRFGLIRSISLTEPLPELGATVHHRLGLICTVEDEADLALYLDDVVAAARQDERNRLTALLHHGADTLARVLAAQLEGELDEGDRVLCRWLADYLLNRLHVTQWVLDHWGGPVCSELESILGPEHLEAALDRHRQIFAIVGADPALRARLHWNNGALAEACPEGQALRAWVDWPADFRLTTPADGLFGYVLGELLNNAIRHGAPGLAVELEVDVDRGRRELTLCLRNELRPGDQGPRSDKTYGGLAIAVELARLCGWELSASSEGERFLVRWACPLTLQRPRGTVD